MKTKQIPAATCFSLGLAGVSANFIAAILMLVQKGGAHFFRVAYLALIGAMILFLALLEKGQERKKRRTFQLFLFFALVLSYSDLPILAPILEAGILPIIGALYRPKEKWRSWVALVIAEITFAIVRTLFLTDFLGVYKLEIMALSILFVSLFRFVFLYSLYKRNTATA